MEHVVLVSEDGTPTGSLLKSEVHTKATPLHLAFSCYLVGEDGRLLVTRRALSKTAWPGVWTNSFCGHPQPGEDLEAAVHRRAEQELGAEITALQLVLPDFRYRAVDDSGIVENEICPVYTARLTGPLNPHPAELVQWEWAHPGTLRQAVEAAPYAFSPWMVEQLAQMPFLDRAR